MRTENFDDGSFFLFVDPPPSIRGLAVCGMSTVAPGVLQELPTNVHKGKHVESLDAVVPSSEKHDPPRSKSKSQALEFIRNKPSLLQDASTTVASALEMTDIKSRQLAVNILRSHRNKVLKSSGCAKRRRTRRYDIVDFHPFRHFCADETSAVNSRAVKYQVTHLSRLPLPRGAPSLRQSPESREITDHLLADAQQFTGSIANQQQNPVFRYHGSTAMDF
ncbi:hypothetical protein ON010_g2949 [Phytophthora cinnamomi]|nr:hypothetical protein ON010_g2949 [Phytophthora cinnamomi]